MSKDDERYAAGKRNLAIEHRAISTLAANPRNARTHSKRQVKMIAESIKSFGFTSPVLIDEDGMILAGHGRVEAAKHLGLRQVPTIRIDKLNEAQKRAFVLAENRLAERAGWDREILAVELGELSVMLPDAGLVVDLTGFEVGEIDAILTDAEEEKAADPDDDLEPLALTPVSLTGDLWALGRHRLLHGDARDDAALRRLLEDERADAAVMDPPYNVQVDGHVLGNGKRRHMEFAAASGEMTDEEFTAFLESTLKNAAGVSRDGAIHFVFIDWRHLRELLTAGDAAYTELKNLAVWVKSNWGMGSLYRSRHELVAVFKVGTGAHINNVALGRYGRNRSNVWDYPGVTGLAGTKAEFVLHPTVKPVALVADAIKDVTRRGAIVLDLFGGSGTTLIAAERTGRRGRVMELDGRYVDASIRRYEQLTKMEAVHTDTGRTFAEVAVERENNGAH